MVWLVNTLLIKFQPDCNNGVKDLSENKCMIKEHKAIHLAETYCFTATGQQNRNETILGGKFNVANPSIICFKAHLTEMGLLYSHLK